MKKLFFGSKIILIAQGIFDPSINKVSYYYSRDNNQFDFLILGYFKLNVWYSN